jgi:hypothetical protein
MDAVVLYPEVGVRTDPANAGGSLHAKMGDAKNLLNAVNANVSRAPWAAGKTPVWLYGRHTTSIPSSTTTDVLTLSGPRIILGGHILVQSSEFGNNSILIDGVSHTISKGVGPYNVVYGDGAYGNVISGTGMDMFTDGYYSGMADYRFFTSYGTTGATLLGGGIFTLPMMYIQSSLIVRLTAHSSYSNETRVVYNIFHTAV